MYQVIQQHDGPAHSPQARDVAVKLLQRKFRDTRTGLPTLCYWARTFYRYLDGKWTALTQREIQSALIDALTGITIRDNSGNQDVEYLAPTSISFAASVSMALEHLVQIGPESAGESPPLWLGSGPCPVDPLRTIATRDKLIDLSCDTVVDRTIEWFDPVVCPVRWDPEAQAPLFEAFLARNGNGANWTELVLRMMAYCQVADRSYHKFFVLGLTPRTGKSLLNNLQRKMLGGTTAMGGGFEEREVGSFSASDHTTSGLERARLLAINETQDLSPSQLQVLLGKLLRFVGDETIYVNPKFGQPFTAIHRIKVKLTGNDLPGIDDPGNSLWTKAVFIPFNRPVQDHERDESLGTKLEKELPGIVRMVVEAGRRMYRERLPWLVVDGASEMLDEVQSRANNAALFVRERCERSGSVPVSELYQAYRRFCRERELDEMTQVAFTRRITTAFPVQKKQVRVGSSRIWVFEGLSVLGSE